MMTRLCAAMVSATLIGCASDSAIEKEARYRLVEDPAESAIPVAMQILTHLAAGEIDEAARFSNAPARRREVLNEFRARVGDQEFKRFYREYLSPKNLVIAEVALGPRRLLVWRLGTAADQVVGQYYVLVDGRFVMDDERSSERSELARALARYRSSK